MNKKAISAIVATVLIILITVAGVAIIWTAIVPMIQQNLAFSNLEGQVRIMTSGGYTSYDAEKKIAIVQVKRDADDSVMDRIKIIFTFKGDSYSSLVVAPEPNQMRTYAFNLSGYGVPESVSVAPVFVIGKTEKEGSITSTVTIPKGTLAETPLVLLNLSQDYQETSVPDCTHDDNCSSPGTCQTGGSCVEGSCSYDAITSCVNGDGCCPTGCTIVDDNDCDGAPDITAPSINFTSPTPDNGTTISTSYTTINVSVDENVSSCILSWDPPDSEVAAGDGNTVFIANDGRIWVFYLTGSSIYYKYSDDSGSTWSSAMHVVSGSVHNPRVIQTTTGRILLHYVYTCGSHYQHPYYMYTDNNGASWSSPSSTSGDVQNSPAGLFQASDGRIWLFYWRPWEGFCKAWSDDDGSSWSTQCYLWRASHNPDLECKNQATGFQDNSGKIWAIYGSPDNGGDLKYRTSTDNCSTWSSEYTLTTKEVLYPTGFEDKNGDLCVFGEYNSSEYQFCHNGSDWSESKVMDNASKPFVIQDTAGDIWNTYKRSGKIYFGQVQIGSEEKSITNYTMDVHNADANTWANYTVTNLTEGTEYIYWVTCNDTGGNEDQTGNRSLFIIL